MRITPNNAGLGARVEGIDLSRSLTPEDFKTVLRALGQYGVLCFPQQDLDAPALSAFGSRFGELEVNVANLFHAEGHPEVMHLSNMKDENGKPIGLSDAGQGWHTDMSYSREIALANVLHAKRVPLRMHLKARVALGADGRARVHVLASILPEGIRPLIEANPMVPLISAYQGIFVYGQWPLWSTLWPSALLAGVLCLLAMRLFRKRSGEMVDEL